MSTVTAARAVLGRGRSPRSYLYVPGDSEQKLAKATSRGADAIIVDLEDAVAPVRKIQARATTRAWLGSLPPARAHTVELWVRINVGGLAADDLAAVFCPALRGICVPKVSSPSDLGALDLALAELEREAGVPSGTTVIQPLIETASGILSSAQIARAERVCQLQLGEVDLSSELGARPGADELEMLLARSQLVLASASAGLRPPVGPASVDFCDLEHFGESSRALKRLGYRSRACIHPAQVEVVNDVFASSTEEIEQARALIAAFDRAVESGSGVVRGPQGQMVDEAVVRAARLLVAGAG